VSYPFDRHVPHGRLATLLEQHPPIGSGHARFVGGNRVLIAGAKRDCGKRDRNEARKIPETVMRDAIVRRCLNTRIYCTTTKRHLRVPVRQNPTANRGETVAGLPQRQDRNAFGILCDRFTTRGNSYGN
jgi:hypothetical protein